MTAATSFDVVIVGAGLSGIDAAYHLQTKLPGLTYAILESRPRLGGTWDLFRYPGIRSDSDMFTLGFPFRPWPHKEAIAGGAQILEYIRETAEHFGIDKKIRFDSKVEGAAWSTPDARWTLDITNPRAASTAVKTQLTCRFLFLCSGYYDYDAGFTPALAGRDRFRGQIVHPQAWSDAIDYTNKRVIVIGSGATAVTLVPALAKKAAHVTMLQRTPTYILSRPAGDPIANWAREHLSPARAGAVARWKSALLGHAFYTYTRRFPASAKKLLLKQVRRHVRDRKLVAEHFTPPYNPWDQRLCLVPDADLFRALETGHAEVVTDHIETFTETGVRLKSGRELDADLIITATGLQLKLMGGLALVVDGQRVAPSTKLAYKGMMVSDVPNLAFAIGYTNASWTLKCDLTSRYVCRLLAHMTAHGHRQCVPRRVDPSVQELPIIDFSSSYVQRAIHLFPKQGDSKPWRLYQNYVLDVLALQYGRVTDRAMQFSS